jgi:hypothetical protein
VISCCKYIRQLKLTYTPAAAGQNSNAGMLPPSDSDEDSEYEAVPVKKQAAQVQLT